uniref:hypothetical protein n=2 Tax=Prevotellamassilia timonensis TaxID=1852370 RepID=UPI004038F295
IITMKLQKKGLLSDCEHLLTPLTTDQEGNLRGGFATMSGENSKLTNGNCRNNACINYSCQNVMCRNTMCGNETCSNNGCSNTDCFSITKLPEPTVTPKTTLAANTAVGLLGHL